MNRLFVLLFLLISFFIKAQEHSIGSSVGLSMFGIPVSLNYQFSFKSFNTKSKITYFPVGLYAPNNSLTNDYFVGIKTKDNKPVILYFNSGVSILHAPQSQYFNSVSDQVNPIQNLSIATSVHPNHRITTDISFFTYKTLTVNKGGSTKKESDAVLTIEIGYAYKFTHKKKQMDNEPK